ncbi:hypothetical protein GCM10010912_64030 [Paenibacillus albidus]|uniref:Uncharacterized protein n=1 Tax=Paenibacillus albidus TaxID=2041023 RepID=A0A917D4X6_9BACL|nr:choice-of-anchor I family protein [Paenibacillus albidus]GGG10819.1 hypothetical protein GCM10010912_64030 [Paenibacillus albidus]
MMLVLYDEWKLFMGVNNDLKSSGKAVLSFLIAAEMVLGSGWAAGPVVAAAAPQAGAPYTADGSYDVSVPHIIVNQIYGGGDPGTTGGYFSSGYIELYNQTDTDVDLKGWSLQYSDPNMNGTWSKLDLSGTIKAHSSYLVTDSKVNPSFQNDIRTKGDQVWPELLFYNKGMKVVLLSSTELLQAANPFQDRPEGYVDMIGTAGNDNGSTIDGYENDYPTGKTEGTSKQKSVRRDQFTDTDNNKADLRQIGFETLDAGALNLFRPHNRADGPWGISVPELGIATQALPDARVGSPYSVTLAVYGGVGPYIFAASGLPEGLTLEASSGKITGTPSLEGSNTVTLSVYDSSSVPMTAQSVLSLQVEKAAGGATPDRISITKIGGYSVGTTNKDGGVAEIVRYNPDNGKFYLVNGSSHPATVDIVNLGEGTHPQKETSINVEALSETDGFQYGDLTSVDINTATQRIAVAVQEADGMKNGKVLVLDYSGELLASYEAGVQPDMVKFTKDGRNILTADEAEPRSLEGDPEGSVTVIDTVLNSVDKVKFTDPSVIDDLVHIRGAADPVTKQIMGAGAKEDAVRDLEPEFIELSGDQRTAYVALQENNAIAAVDIASRQVLWVKGLGVKDLNDPRNALDLLKDDRIHLENVPFYGVYMPDGISGYSVGGKSYLFTANEGDATEWDSKVNASKVGDMKGLLLPKSPAALFLNGQSQYDGVEVMSDMGHDGIYMYGARSFSIWDADTMKQVYDSGSDFEKITAERLPDVFNASNSNTTLDSRSPKKGPEPEYVKVGQVGQKALAFIGLERIGGLMTYDVTNPEQPGFVSYIHSREFTPKNNLNTDTGPEGIDYIPATASPTGLPLVLVANEVGGTVAVYQLNVTKVTLDQASLSLKAGGATASLQATVVPVGEGAATATWISSNPEVASVDSSGKVTPLTQGEAVISAYSADGYGEAQAKVSVSEADPVAPSPEPSPSPSPSPAPSPGGNSGSNPGTVPGSSPSPSPAASPNGAASSPNVTVEGSKVILKVNGVLDTAGQASATLDLKTLEAAMGRMTAGADGELVVRLDSDGAAQKVRLNLPAGVFKAISTSAASRVTWDTAIGSVSFNRAALEAVSSAAGTEEISFSVAKSTAAASAKVGGRPVVDLTLRAGSKTLGQLGQGRVTVNIPYTLSADEDPKALVAYSRSEKGVFSAIPHSSYDALAGALTFTANHFSTFAVGYNPVSFADIGNSYARDAITYLAAREVISGVSEGRFAPKSGLTRADATLLLAHMGGADLSTAAESSFTDVKPSDYYAAAAAWGNRNGIVSGIGGGRFDPKAGVTREQLAVMIHRLAEAMDWSLPVSAAGAAFADQQQISAYALEAAEQMQQAGIISGRSTAGSNGKQFDPKAAASREETAQMLAKLLKLAE